MILSPAVETRQLIRAEFRIVGAVQFEHYSCGFPSVSRLSFALDWAVQLFDQGELP